MAVLSGIMNNGKLVSRKKWESYIKSLKLKVKDAGRNKKAMKKELRQKITEAVARRMPKKRFGIMLSGGVDSSLIALMCRKLGGNFICYSAGLENSKDVAEARKAAAAMKLKLRYKIFTLKEAEKVIRKAAALVGEDAVNVGIASVAIAAAQLARKDGIKTFFTGLGSEEIFAGYQRHEMAKDANEECWNGLKKMWSRDLIRDCKAAASEKISFLTPFLDRELIIAAMSIPAKYKISRKEKKIILREAAVEMGLPAQFAFRKKIAAQYGSGFDRAIGQLARKKHFRYKRDYIASISA